MTDNQYPSYTQRERVRCDVFARADEAAGSVARAVADLIRERAGAGAHCVLGLATGSSPIGVYEEWVRMHRDEGLSFRNVITFNLDEYYPMRPAELQSYHRFMREYLFDHIDIEPQNVHIPDGTVAEDRIQQYCDGYERAIAQAGGIDVQLLGIGRTGHIGFNEPGSSASSRTRRITLDRVTRIDAASDFFGEDNVPRHAITMGVGTILDARRIFLLAFGEHKAPIVARAVEGPVSPSVAASFLQQHADARFVLDQAAAAQLTRQASPWVLGPIEWDETTVRRAVIWLARHLEKPILKLTDHDYNEEGLQDLLAEQGPAYDINVRVFRHLQATITGWPAGKPEAARQPGDAPRPIDDVYPKRILVFSPHPDDDVISMGGTLNRLADQGHEVHVAYQTSGNIAVFDDDAMRFAEFVAEFNGHFDIAREATDRIKAKIDQSIEAKKAGQVDSYEVQQIKGIIRRTEARAATRCCGIPGDRLHFLDMPFYETGRVKKKPLSEEDIDMIVRLLDQLRPHQIYAAGDLSDPHGTHRTCLSAVVEACRRFARQSPGAEPEVWLYRGAWHEWEPHEIEMAVPLSPQEVLHKRNAIFKHESQKDRALFPGPDAREFWQRAEARNAATARLYDQLGLAEYQAIEGFVKWKG